MKDVIIHCSDTPNGHDYRAIDIHQWHLNRGWSGIGYHYVVCVDGTIENGRPEYWEGAHCRGHNEKIGVCLIGKDKFTRIQKLALSSMLNNMEKKCGLGDVKGHYQYDSNKTCPNFDVEMWCIYNELWPMLDVSLGE